jgi:hypothetical protein
MKFDIMNDIDVKRALSPKAAVTDNTAYVSEILDMKGAHAAGLIILIGANTDTNATFTTLLEESDASDMTGATAVSDNDLIGTEALASFTAADDDNKVKKLGYIGSKRYIRATITPAGNDSGNHFVAAVWLRGHLENAPAPNPPA